MIVEINKNQTVEQVEQALQSFVKSKRKGNLLKHFGKLKRGLNGLKFQKKVRNEWD